MAIFFGTAQGLQPLIGLDFGAKDYKGMRSYFLSSRKINVVGSLIVYALLILFGGTICGFFGDDAETLDFTIRVIPLYAWGFTAMACNTMISAYFYSTKRTKGAIIMNTMRSFIVNTLAIIFGKEIIWFAFGLSELVILLVAGPMTVKADKKLLNS